MKIAIGSDHGGFELKECIKEFLQSEGIGYKDFGTHDTGSVDYPDFASKVASAVVSGECDRGILCCGTGIGISIAANKVPGIRAALCGELFRNVPDCTTMPTYCAWRTGGGQRLGS